MKLNRGLCIFISEGLNLLQPPYSIVIMSRFRKKVQSDDEQVSIFDSDQEESSHKERHRNKNNKEKKEKKVRIVTQKSIEKKLIKTEEHIMREILGEEQEEKGEITTLQEKNTFIKEEETQQTLNIPNKNNLEEEEQKIEEEELTWNDFQEARPRNQERNSKIRGKGAKPMPIHNHYGVHNYPYPTYPPNNHHYNIQQSYNPPYPPYFPFNANQPYYPNAMYGQYPPQPYYPFNPTFPPPPNKPSSQPEGQQPEKDPQIFDSAQFDEQTLIGLRNQKIPSEKPQQKIVKIQSENKEMRDEQMKICRIKRKQTILQQIQILKQDYYNILDKEEEEPREINNEIKQIQESLFKEWKYDQSITKTFDHIKVVKFEPEDQKKFMKSKSDARAVMVDQVLSQNPFLTQNEMAEVLKARDFGMNEKIERSTVLRLLKIGGYQKKKIRMFSKDRNNPVNKSLRYNFALCHQHFTKQNANFFYYDQLVVNQYFDKESGWCRKEEEIHYQPIKFVNRSVVVMVIMAKDGTCKWDAKVGKHSEKEFCLTLSKMMKNIGKGTYNNILVVNPLPYRKPLHIREVAYRRQWDLLVLPQQAIYLNPLQAYFFEVKQLLKRRKFLTLEKLFEQIVSILRECDRNKVGRKTMSRVEIYLDKALAKQGF